MAKCSKCDYKYATYEKCPNCGADKSVSIIDEIGRIINRIILIAIIIFVCYIIWPVETSKVIMVFSNLIKLLRRGFTGT